MANWKGIIGKPLTIVEFSTYLETVQWISWKPSMIVLHNTYRPTLAQRPKGFTEQNMKDLETYYRDTMKWSAGPHMFVDDVKIWLFTPLTVPGVHSPSWNSKAVGIEMLGDYETEQFLSGRGAAVRYNALAAAAALCIKLGIDPKTIKLHKDDPKTTHKTCPGKNVDKVNVIATVENIISHLK